jgi:DNA modification methylase
MSENNLFGNPSMEGKRNLNDFFIVKPFSVLNTMDQTWLRRKAYWLGMISDRGKSRESVLFKKSKGETTKIGGLIQSFNDGVSLFDPVLSEVLIRWFSEPRMRIVDPFAGDESRGFVACCLDRHYTGIELRKEQVDLNYARIEEAGYDKLCDYICDTSLNLDQHVPDNTADFIFTCPPYAFLEKYSDDLKDLSNMPIKEFFETYRQILYKTYNALKENRFAAIVVSEVRDKDGSYIGLVPKTTQYMEEAGYKYYNEIILMNNVGTLRFRVGNQMNSGRKIGRLHQNVLIFYKGDINKIRSIFSDIIGD